MIVGSIRVQATQQGDEQQIRVQVANIFRKVGVTQFVVEVVKQTQAM